MVSSNQRSINEGIRKGVGSSNRGFASIDPERQRGIVTQGGKSADDTAKQQQFNPSPVRGVARTSAGEGGSGR